jgi:hypothetical protein
VVGYGQASRKQEGAFYFISHFLRGCVIQEAMGVISSVISMWMPGSFWELFISSVVVEGSLSFHQSFILAHFLG